MKIKKESSVILLPPGKYRLGLERSHSAEEAITVITDLLESYGQVAKKIIFMKSKFINCQVSSMEIFGLAQTSS